MVYAIVTMLLVQMQNGFAIRFGFESMPESAELLAQLAVVINLAVRHKPQRTVRVREGLMAASEVDDRQPAHADRTWAVAINPIVVRPAVDNGLTHSAKSFHRRGLPVEL